MKEEMFEIAKMLYSVKLFDNAKERNEIIESCINLACDFEHIKKGYWREGEWNFNPDYELLLHWISLKSGYVFDGSDWIMSEQEKARKRFG